MFTPESILERIQKEMKPVEFEKLFKSPQGTSSFGFFPENSQPGS
ncbi:hypothetical protein HMPREF0620_1201 [Parascardovia denticolens DSM 10105 = JCM 12538]|uniref:Uncharacterized protein n=1 Tax=Parascardovia denticolens DSM 10105 = JCM 12538 TaxID=864564 RepID=E6K0C3_PARDN|nr:hypothetical protein HMPREF0620_1201 [Parascardovia denticolens DSM 10105 = JCM 12538]BAR04985.1 hypothetical protein PSDT_0466 [Parascardovia denticolens DSM 10105 = JCM 12538]